MSLSLSLLFLLAMPAQADPVAAIAPLLGDEIVAVVHIDLERLDFVDTINRVSGSLANDKHFAQEVRSTGTLIESFEKAGAKDLFLMLDPADLRKLPKFVLTLKPGSAPQPLQSLVMKMLPVFVSDPVSVEVIDGLVVGGPQNSIRRNDTRKYPPRAELAAAFAASGDSPAKLLIIPGAIQRKALEETIDKLPPELGGAPITTFTQGLKWGTLYLTQGDKPGSKLLLQGKDAAIVGKLATLATFARTIAIERLKQTPGLASSAEMLDKLNFEEKDDRLVIDVSPDVMSDLIVPFIQSAREARWRLLCVQNIKQIGLAMHNYHGEKDSFPRQATTDQSGKPLLSWRVQLLPYLDQQELYNKFHLDEPWDSVHNKALISQMPAVFACPKSNHLATEGKTCYLVPHGNRTILSGEHGGSIKNCTDGTSNTIMAVEAGDNASVIWTKPDDWRIGDDVSFEPLLGRHAGGTTILLGDGSARFVKDTIKKETLKALITRDGGEVIGSDSF